VQRGDDRGHDGLPGRHARSGEPAAAQRAEHHDPDGSDAWWAPPGRGWIVTLSIGGNDIGFTSIIENCAAPTPFGHPCQDKYNSGGVDQLAARVTATAPKVAAVIQGIHQRSPSARVVVVAYEPILPESGSGCWPQVPLAWADVPYLRATQKRLNTMLQTTAAANGARYADTYSAAIGHDSCKSSSTRWVEPLIPGNTAAPFHPNQRGMAGVTPTVVAAATAP
jgi:hypothetical protein